MLIPLLALLGVLPVQTEAPALPSKALLETSALVGTWHAVLDRAAPNGAQEVRLALWQEGDGLSGGLRAGDDTGLVRGALDSAANRLHLGITLEDATGELELGADELGYSGRLDLGGDPILFRMSRASEEIDHDLVLEVDFKVERPSTIDRDGLPDFLEEAVQPILDAWVRSHSAVGVSAAFILDYEVVDIRSRGWQDFARRIPATARTRYRWGSISKPVTAVAALQLVESGDLDLDRDVREYVPEFPEKRWKLTSAHLLCHQGGVVHYQHEPIVTEREYDDPNPFRDRILALDMFKESPLLFEPGSQYSYTTHGYSVLGAVVERAGKRSFVEQVRERIVERLGMTTLQPDFHQSVYIPDQTKGYVAIPGGRAMDSGDSNVAWKLPGGGFLSNVEDLALFGLGLMEDRLLSEKTRMGMFTAQKTASGTETDYGLGVSIEMLNEVRAIGHGGAQRKTRTYLLFVPEIGVGVAVMCNTESVDIRALGRPLLAALLE